MVDPPFYDVGDGYSVDLSPSSPSVPASKSNGHVSGGLPMISDSMFSLVILVYVSVAFCFVFFMFCWKSDAGRNGRGGNKRQCILMTNVEGHLIADTPAELVRSEIHTITLSYRTLDSIRKAELIFC